MKKVFLKAAGIAFLLFFVIGILTGATWWNRFSHMIALRTSPSVDPTLVLEHETSGVLNIATNPDSIGNARPTGVTKTLVFDFGNDTFGDQWVPAAADSDVGIRFNGDIIIDSVSVLSTFGSGDSAHVTIYKTTANVTTVSGIDTLFSAAAGYQTIDLTGVATSTRSFDVSAGQFPAILVDEHGTLLLVSVFIYYREYDVQ